MMAGPTNSPAPRAGEPLVVGFQNPVDTRPADAERFISRTWAALIEAGRPLWMPAAFALACPQAGAAL